MKRSLKNLETYGIMEIKKKAGVSKVRYGLIQADLLKKQKFSLQPEFFSSRTRLSLFSHIKRHQSGYRV
jgi:hypothetical protein